MIMTSRMIKAWDFAKSRHGNQIDDNGKNYFDIHIVPVADIISRVTNDEDIIIAAILHDTLEDTDARFQDIVNLFGKRVANLVYECTNEIDENGAKYFPRLHSRDAIMIKLADRLSNISRMDSWSEERREHYLKRTRFWRDIPTRQRGESHGNL